MPQRESEIRQLSDLEAEFLAAVEKELTLEASGKASLYFTRKLPFLADGRRYQDDKIAQLERLERSVSELHQRIGDPDLGPVVATVEAFAAGLKDGAALGSGGRVALARELLTRLTSNNRFERSRGVPPVSEGVGR
jgi:hypothetical protein